MDRVLQRRRFHNSIRFQSHKLKFCRLHHPLLAQQWIHPFCLSSGKTDSGLVPTNKQQERWTALSSTILRDSCSFETGPSQADVGPISYFAVLAWCCRRSHAIMDVFHGSLGLPRRPSAAASASLSCPTRTPTPSSSPASVQTSTASPTASFSILPVEILQKIGGHLTDFDNHPALAALAATSRRNHWVFNEILYRADAACPAPSMAMLGGAANGQITTLQRAVAYGADINWFGDVGNLPDPREASGGWATRRQLRDFTGGLHKQKAMALHLAAIMGHDEAVGWLLDHGSKLHVGAHFLCQCHLSGNWKLQSWPSQNPKAIWHAHHLALCYGHVSTFRTLMWRGASLTRTGGGVPADRLSLIPRALHQAAYVGNYEAVEIIVQLPRIDAAADCMRALELVYSGSGLGNGEGRRNIIRRLMELGSYPAGRHDTHGSITSILQRAFKSGAFGAAIDILESGACPQLPGGPEFHGVLLHSVLDPRRRGYRKLHEDDPQDPYSPDRLDVWYRERLDLVRVLVTRGTDINRPWVEPDGTTVTPLMLVAHPGRPPDVALEMVKLVLALGANPQATSPNGTTVLHYIVKAYRHEVFKQVATPRSPLSTLKYLIENHNVAVDATDNIDKKKRTVLDYVYDTTAETHFWQHFEPNNPLPLTDLRPGQKGNIERKFQEWCEQRVVLAETLLLTTPLPLQLSWFEMELDRLKVARNILQLATRNTAEIKE